MQIPVPHPTALVTGATSGIGEAFARRLAKNGYDLVLTGRRAEIIGTVAEGIRTEYGVRVEVLIADFSQEQDIALVEERIRALPRLDMLVNNAGYGINGTFIENPVEDSLTMNRVHIDAPVRFCKAALPGMLKQGRGDIINVSSVAAFTPTPGIVAYGASKAYLNNFSEALAVTIRGKGIRIQALCPGFTKTDFHLRMGQTKDFWKNRGIMRWMDPVTVVDISLKKLSHDSVVCIPGLWNNCLILAVKILPRWVVRLVRLGNARKRERMRVD